MRKKRILGQETEYGMIIKQLPRDLEMLEIAKRLYYRFIPLCLRGEAAAREMSWKTDYFLANGGRFYYDAGDHPEYATPECLSARQLVCCSEAGDRLLEELQAEANEQLAALGLPSRIYLYRNNHDGKRHTYGCHENYAVKPEIFNSLAAYGSNAAKDFFLAYLMSSVIYTGAGNVIYDPKSEELKFVLSQRARFVRYEVANSGPPFLPMINGNNESHAGEDLRRLHVMGRDTNIANAALYLKFGTARIILDMIEDGCFNRNLALKNAIQSYRQFSFDPSLKFRAELKNGKKYTAIEIQKILLEEALSHVSGCGGGEEDKDIVEKWGIVLDGLSRLKEKPRLLLGDVDWVTKKFILDEELNKITRRPLDRGLAFSSFKGRTRNSLNDFLNFARTVNIQYHDLRRERGLYYRFRDFATRIVSPCEIKKAITEPPKGARAELRGFLVNAFNRPEMASKYHVAYCWHFMQWYYGSSNKCIDLSDPYANRFKPGVEKLLPKDIKVPKKFRTKK